MMDKNAKIYVAGHRGMVGSAIVRELQRQGYTNIITRTHAELDLTRQEAVFILLFLLVILHEFYKYTSMIPKRHYCICHYV